MSVRICYKCLHVATPVQIWSKNARIFYLGCEKCGCGVFFN